MDKLTDFCEDKRHFRPVNNAARERSRVKTLRSAFLDLQRSLPAVPPNTKLSKLDILVLATAYIYHLTKTLEDQDQIETDQQQAVSYCLRGVPSSQDEKDGFVPHQSDRSVHQLACLPASDPCMKPALPAIVTGRHVSDCRLKPCRQSVSCGRYSPPSLSLSNPNIFISRVSQSNRLSPIEMKSSLLSAVSMRRLQVRGAVGILHPVKFTDSDPTEILSRPQSIWGRDLWVGEPVA